MPPKKKGAEDEPPRILFGRPSNSLQIGVVGLPNVGKSTLFNVLTKLQIPAENFPFCTIDPNEARVSVPDARYDYLCGAFKPASKVPPVLHVTDIAGLIRGAAEGEGLGNAFLSHIRATDGILHVLRIFEDEDITHVEGNVDPVRDIEIINNELMLKDIETCQKRIETLKRELSHTSDKKKKQELEIVEKAIVCLEKKIPIRFGDWKTTDVDWLNSLQLLSAKPVVYVINMSERDYIRQRNKWLIKIKEFVDKNGKEPMVPFCGAFEQKLLDMETPEEVKKYCEENKVQSGIPKIIKIGYSAINLIHFFTCGTDEVKCWTIRKWTKAPQAAGTIHTDFEKGFVKAEVMKFEDFKELGSETAVKAAGKMKQEGKNYVVCDGDIIHFKANTVGLKK